MPKAKITEGVFGEFDRNPTARKRVEPILNLRWTGYSYQQAQGHLLCAGSP